MLALALVLPVLTAQIPQIGGMLCPMHFPVLLCGFFAGPIYGLFTGLIAPIMRYFIFGMPAPLYPKAIIMALELAGYGVASGYLYNNLRKTTFNIYISLVGAMIFGRIIWGVSKAFFYGLEGTKFGIVAFVSGGIINSIPGIIAQIILIPLIVRKIKI